MKIIKNAILIPLEGTMDSFTGGVFTFDGQFIEDSLLCRGRPAELQKPVEHLSGTYIYGGCLFGHFGHFIWESLSRLYTIRQCKNYPILFISPNDRIFNVQKMLFKSIGVNNEIFLVKASTSVESLIYSSPGSTLNPVFISDKQIDSLKYFDFAENTSKEKIWLSRSKLEYGKVTNEPAIEKELIKAGYDIIHPQTLPLREQVRLVGTSDIIAGFDGSQFFSLLFSKEIYGKFFVFNRRRDIPSAIPYAFQKRNVTFEQHIFDLESVNSEWPITTYHLPEPTKIIEILNGL